MSLLSPHPTASRPQVSAGNTLGLLFAGAMLLIAGTAVLTFFMGKRVIAAQQRMTDDLGVLKKLPDFIAVITEAETGQRGYLLTGETEYLDPYNRAVAAISAEKATIASLADSRFISSAESQELLDLTSRKMQELQETIDLRKSQGIESALAVVRRNHGKELMGRIRTVIGQITDRAERDYADAIHISEVATTTRTTTFILATLLNLGFLAWAYARINRQAWFRIGQMNLSRALSGDQTLADTGDHALKELVNYLRAQAGALFTREGNEFRRIAAYGVPSGARVLERFSVGDGLLGQAAKDDQPIVVDAVPEGYLVVGSGLGASRPKQLVIVPMHLYGQVTTVVELGFFARPGKLVVPFLQQVAEALTVSLRSATYRARLQELLEETQRQAEELQSQSEELRVSNEELSEQSRALKDSQTRLEQQQVELEQTNAQLEEQAQLLEKQKDTVEKAKAEVEQQARKVEQASRYKSDFLANMSHELRTPLNSSLILAKLLADNKAGNLTPEQVKYAKTIESAGNDLLNLINDVLDLSKIEAGHFELHPATFSLKALNENLRLAFEPVARQKDLVLTFSIAPGTPENIYTDAQRLEQILKNLLSNALKFTERGEVGLHIQCAAPGKISFAVRDTGIGIAQNQQQLIFDPFVQADSATNRKFGGTGLGLSISQQLVRLLGGGIHLSSEPGKGSVFTVTIPDTYSAAVLPPPEMDRPVVSIQPEPAPETRDSPGPVVPPPQQHGRIADDRERLSGDKRTILIVEDDESFAQILSDLAHETAFQSLIATSAEEALALAQQFSPSALVLDIGLPDNSGMYVLERLKADHRTRHIPVHVVSGRDYAETARSLGAVGYMLKPVKREQLEDAFKKLEVRLSQKLRRVLVVEDDPVQLDSLQKLLATSDVQTVGVQTAASCLEALSGTTFDCMVLDLSLPDASGFNLLQTLSERDAYSFPPVIIYTGRALNPDEEQRLRKYSKSIIIKGAKSPERLLDEVTLFLHQVVSDLAPEQQQMLAKARSRDADLEGRTVLVVEDDIRNVFALTSLLEAHGVKLEIARNGKEALSMLDRAQEGKGPRPDLVLMDIMMPEMDGLTAMREIRRRSEWKKLPMIALTAKAMKNDHKDCLEAGANDYLAKPLNVEKLLSLVRVWMPR